MAHFSHAYRRRLLDLLHVRRHRARCGRGASACYDAIWRDGLEATTRVGGTISHHHGVGLLKAPYMAGEHREAMAIFEAAKTSLDPDDIMNPGKMGLAGRPLDDALRRSAVERAVGAEHVERDSTASRAGACRPARPPRSPR